MRRKRTREYAVFMKTNTEKDRLTRFLGFVRNTYKARRKFTAVAKSKGMLSNMELMKCHVSGVQHGLLVRTTDKSMLSIPWESTKQFWTEFRRARFGT